MLLTLLLAGSAAVATPVDHSQRAVAVTTKAEKKICKRDEATESRMGSKRICKTAAQWRQDRDARVEEDAKAGLATRAGKN